MIAALARIRKAPLVRWPAVAMLLWVAASIAWVTYNRWAYGYDFDGITDVVFLALLLPLAALCVVTAIWLAGKQAVAWVAGAALLAIVAGLTAHAYFGDGQTGGQKRETHTPIDKDRLAEFLRTRDKQQSQAAEK